jgi:hypothetical protein
MTSPSKARTSAPASNGSARAGTTGSASNAWATGLTMFAGVMLATVGLFQFFQGLAAIMRSDFYVVAPNNIYEFSTSSWGWVHLLLGIVLAVTGFFILTDRPWARIIGIAVAALSALANFLFIPYYPIWALVIIAMDVAVIWALATYRPAQD